MKNVSITDILGNFINCKHPPPFIIINTPYNNILDKIVSLGNSIIYSISKLHIQYILNMFNIDYNKYCVTGDILLPIRYNNLVKILLVSRYSTYSSKPIDFIKINNIAEFNIWKPICPPGYEYIGYLTSKEQPQLDDTICVRSDIIHILNKDNLNIFGIKKNTSIDNNIDSLSDYKNNWSHFSSYGIGTCNNLLESSFATINMDNSNDVESDVSFETYGGKYVKLVQNDNPWFNIKDDVPINKKKIYYQDNSIIHSYLNNDDSKFYYIISSLVTIFIMLITIRYYVYNIGR